MKISALTIECKRITVVINPEDDRHVVVNGEEIDLHDQHSPDLERKISNKLDALYDLPIYEDGIIHTGKTNTVYAWQAASVEED